MLRYILKTQKIIEQRLKKDEQTKEIKKPKSVLKKLCKQRLEEKKEPKKIQK